MAGVLTLDLETTTKTSYKRKANPLDEDNRIVAWGLQRNRNAVETYYETDPNDDWLHGVGMIVGHNLKFDLLYLWGRKDFRAWLKAGGKIFDTQFAEYLISGQRATYASLDDCSKKYGGELKNDEIKAMWEAGIDTPDIPKDMLIDYLEWDIKNTRKVFDEQILKIKELGLMATVHTHMEGLLAIIEMEYNGMFVDKVTAERQRVELEDSLKATVKELHTYIPKDLPEEIVWNWGSRNHLSALFFGGTIKYKKKMPILDENGNKTYTKKKESWYMVDKVPIHPDDITEGMVLDTFKTGKKAGTIKTCNVLIQGDLKERYEECFFEIKGMSIPEAEWETKNEGVFKTDSDVLGELEDSIPAAKLMQDWRRADKDLGTYYRRYDAKKKCDVGMLTLVQPDGIIHHKLNNCATVTGRLSSSDPKD